MRPILAALNGSLLGQAGTLFRASKLFKINCSFIFLAGFLGVIKCGLILVLFFDIGWEGVEGLKPERLDRGQWEIGESR
jgi:hypothetical protein